MKLFIVCLASALAIFALALLSLITSNPEEARLLLSPLGLVLVILAIIVSLIVSVAIIAKSLQG